MFTEQLYLVSYNSEDYEGYSPLVVCNSREEAGIFIMLYMKEEVDCKYQPQPIDVFNLSATSYIDFETLKFKIEIIDKWENK